MQSPTPAAVHSAKKSKPSKPKFELNLDEKLGSALERVFNDQLQIAMRAVSGRENIGASIHDARRAIKKARAVLRLARPALGASYQEANAGLRDIGRTLSPIRDAMVLVDIMTELEKHADGAKAKAAAQRAVEALQRSQTHLFQDFAAVEHAAHAGERLKAMLKQSLHSSSKVDLPVLLASVERTVKQGRKARKAATPSAASETFHEWRKRAKDFRYHLSLLQQLWPDVLAGYSAAAKKLEQTLGDEHNLAVLKERLPDLSLAKKDMSLLSSALTDRQAKLRRKAHRLGALLYSDGPKQWHARLANCQRLAV